MTIPDAQKFIGRSCAVTWRDRTGGEHYKVLRIQELSFIPLYGTYLVGDLEDVHLEKVTNIQPLE